MNYKHIAILQALALCVLCALLWGLALMTYDMGKLDGINEEKAKCGVTMRCAEMFDEKGLKAARHRRLKNCNLFIRSWVDGK